MSPSSNPFEAPDARGAVVAQPAAGVLDPVQALTSGWRAMLRNIGPWLGITFVGSFLAAASVFTVIGWIVVIPVLAWGAVVFTLNAEDGEASFNDLFSGFSSFGDALGGMLGYFVLSFIVGLPGSGLSLVDSALTVAGHSNSVIKALAPITSLLWTLFVSIRLFYAPYFIVDQRLGPVDALKASWEATREQKLNNFLMVLMWIPLFLAGTLALCVGILPATWVAYGGLAAAYRQLTGTKQASVT